MQLHYEATSRCSMHREPRSASAPPSKVKLDVITCSLFLLYTLATNYPTYRIIYALGLPSDTIEPRCLCRSHFIFKQKLHICIAPSFSLRLYRLWVVVFGNCNQFSSFYCLRWMSPSCICLCFDEIAINNLIYSRFVTSTERTVWFNTHSLHRIWFVFVFFKLCRWHAIRRGDFVKWYFVVANWMAFDWLWEAAVSSERDDEKGASLERMLHICCVGDIITSN